MAIDPSVIAKAKKAGYSDDEIADHLAGTMPQIAEARKAGYSASEIIGHLSPAPTQKAAPAPDNSRLGGFVEGLMKPIDNLAEAASNIPYVGPAIDRLGQAMGMPSTAKSVAGHDAARARNTRTGYQTAGNIVGTLPTAALKGGAAVQGAVSGALLSDSKDMSGVLSDAGIGAATSFGAQKVLNTMGHLANPVVSKGVKALRDAGVPLTFGQLAGATNTFAGKLAKDVEDKATSLPIVGNVINNARDRGTVAYNKAVLSRSLAPIGQDIPATIKPGKEMVRYVGDKLSEGYQKLLPKLSAAPDQAFHQGMNTVLASTKTLPDHTQKQFAAIINDALPNRAPSGVLAGNALKDAEEKLNDLASQYGKSGDVDQRRLGQAIGAARDELRALVERSNPKHAGELQSLNRGWRELTIAEKAAGGQGNAEGIFTPKQYAAAARAADKSVRNRATTRGTAKNQELTDAAAGLLPNRVPDSGTAGRALNAMMAGSGAGIVGGAFAHPGPLVAGAALAAPYTRYGQKAVNRMFTADRPAMVQDVGKAINALARYAPQAIPAMVVGNGR